MPLALGKVIEDYVVLRLESGLVRPSGQVTLSFSQRTSSPCVDLHSTPLLSTAIFDQFQLVPRRLDAENKRDSSTIATSPDARIARHVQVQMNVIELLTNEFVAPDINCCKLF